MILSTFGYCIIIFEIVEAGNPILRQNVTHWNAPITAMLFSKAVTLMMPYYTFCTFENVSLHYAPVPSHRENEANGDRNISFLLNNFIKCPAYENIVFYWVIHEQSIIDDMLSHLDTVNRKIHLISLVCDKQPLRTRLKKSELLNLNFTVQLTWQLRN